MASCPSESSEQISLITAIRRRGMGEHDFYSVPNGGFRLAREARRLKQEGLKAGVCDLVFPGTPPSKPELKGLYLEMKRQKGGRLSEDQKKWRQSLTEKGYGWEVANGKSEALRLLAEYGYI